MLTSIKFKPEVVIAQHRITTAYKDICSVNMQVTDKHIKYKYYTYHVITSMTSVGDISVENRNIFSPWPNRVNDPISLLLGNLGGSYSLNRITVLRNQQFFYLCRSRSSPFLWKSLLRRPNAACLSYIALKELLGSETIWKIFTIF